MNPNYPKGQDSPLLSPYPLVPRATNRGFIYTFTSRSGHIYDLVFIPDAEYVADQPFAKLAYSFTIDVNIVGPEDPLIGLTVASALDLAFQAQPDLIITYICDASDQRQKARLRKFTGWYRKYSGNQYTHFEHTDEDQIYSAVLFRNNHPYGLLAYTVYKQLFTSGK